MKCSKIYQEILDTVVDELRFEYSGKEFKAMHEEERAEKIDEHVHGVLENMSIITYEAREICWDLGFDVFEDNEIFGKPENWHQAAYTALYTLCHEDNYIIIDVESELIKEDGRK